MMMTSNCDDPNSLWRKAVECADQAAITHLLLGIPPYVLAAASLLVAITVTQPGKKEKISNLVR